MANYQYDAKANCTFGITFFATSQSQADTTAINILQKLFGVRAASLMTQVSVSNVALSGQAVTGANYTYNYSLNVGPGDAANASVSGVTNPYALITAATAADALTSIQNGFAGLLNINPFPVAINRLV
jgi:hypothetical protein